MRGWLHRLIRCRRRERRTAECPQSQAALRFPCIYNSVKPHFFVERDICRLRCLQITRLASRIRAIDHWS